MNESVLIIADFVPNNVEPYQQIDLQLIGLGKLFDKVKSGADNVTYLLLTDTPKATLTMLGRQVKQISAAGGLVKNGKGEFLFIHRLGKWDLPKGKIDQGEKSRESAIREVKEECGIDIHYLGGKILSSYHVYEMRGELVLKKTNWYDMGVNNVPKLTPQTNEDITKAVWMKKKDLPKALSNTYPIIKDIIRLSIVEMDKL